MTTSKIFTLADARDERVRADVRMQVSHAQRYAKVWFVVDDAGRVHGVCQTRKAAEKYIAAASNLVPTVLRAARPL
jgi:hypothetical protein